MFLILILSIKVVLGANCCLMISGTLSPGEENAGGCQLLNCGEMNRQDCIDLGTKCVNDLKSSSPSAIIGCGAYIPDCPINPACDKTFYTNCEFVPKCKKKEFIEDIVKIAPSKRRVSNRCSYMDDCIENTYHCGQSGIPRQVSLMCSQVMNKVEAATFQFDRLTTNYARQSLTNFLKCYYGGMSTLVHQDHFHTCTTIQSLSSVIFKNCLRGENTICGLFDKNNVASNPITFGLSVTSLGKSEYIQLVQQLDDALILFQALHNSGISTISQQSITEFISRLSEDCLIGLYHNGNLLTIGIDQVISYTIGKASDEILRGLIKRLGIFSSTSVNYQNAKHWLNSFLEELIETVNPLHL